MFITTFAPKKSDPWSVIIPLRHISKLSQCSLRRLTTQLLSEVVFTSVTCRSTAEPLAQPRQKASSQNCSSLPMQISRSSVFGCYGIFALASQQGLFALQDLQKLPDARQDSSLFEKNAQRCCVARNTPRAFFCGVLTVVKITHLANLPDRRPGAPLASNKVFVNVPQNVRMQTGYDSALP